MRHPSLPQTQSGELTVVQLCASPDGPHAEHGVTRQQQAHKQQDQCHVDEQVQLVGARNTVQRNEVAWVVGRPGPADGKMQAGGRW